MVQKIWDLVSKEMKQVTTLNKFKAKIKIWKLEIIPTDSVELTADRVHYITLFNMIKVVLLRVSGCLGGNINTAEI